MTAQPVYVVDSSELRENGGRFRLQGGAAIQAYNFDQAELNATGRGVMGGARIPVYVVSQSEIDSGRFRVQGGEPIYITDVVTGRGIESGSAIPVYLINPPAEQAAAGPPAGGQSALYQSLEAGEYWALDEASGQRAGGINSLTLTDNNTVGSDTGLVYPLAGSFVAANSEYLSRASEAALQTGDIDFWVGAWVYMANKGNERSIVAKGIGALGNEYEYGLRYSQSSDQFRWVANDGVEGHAAGVNAITFGSPAINTWLLVLAYHDAANNLIGVGVNGGAFNTAAYTYGSWLSSHPFRVGYWGTTWYYQGRIGPIMFGKGHIPDATECTWLFNAGSGRTLQELYDYAG